MAGQATHADYNCKDRCDNNEKCTGYALWSGNNWCATYTSVGATGQGLSSFECFMKERGTSSTWICYIWNIKYKRNEIK